jgi:signal transduction histidine kinase
MIAKQRQWPEDASPMEAELARLSAALALAERDRQLLGYEIHDGIVQDLTAAALHLESAGREATFTSSEVQDNYAGGVRLLREAIAEARRLIRGLATVELDDRGLVWALQRLVEKFRSDLALSIDFACEAAGLRLPGSVQHLLLRIAQEALFNVWKHAGACRVNLRLAYDGRELELTIADDGAGFDPRQIPGGHFGLEGMRTRAQILGGQLQIDSAAGRGTRVTLRMSTPPLAG